MATIEPCSQGTVVSPEIGKRVLEIMDEKGKAYTQQAIANRIKMNRIALSKKLHGKRDLYLFELRRISEVLHLTVERILRLDVIDVEAKLTEYFKNPSDKDAVLALAQRLESLAVGVSERTYALNNLGRAHFLKNEYQEAHDSWLKAYDLSLKIMEKYENQEMLNLVLTNLMISYTVAKDFTRAHEILHVVEQVFADAPDKLGIASYARAKHAEHEKQLDQARNHAYQSLEYFQLTGNERSIGKAEVTVAHYEYLCGNYTIAESLLENASSKLEPYLNDWLVSMKEYAKTLIRLGDTKQAQTVITAAKNKVSPSSRDQFINLIGKLDLLLSICTGNPLAAERVFTNPAISADLRHLVWKHLKTYCIQNNDKEALMKYVIIEHEFNLNNKDLLDEEVL